MRRFYLLLVIFLLSVLEVSAADDPLSRLASETLGYFSAASGKVIGVDGQVIQMEMRDRAVLKKGMRLNILKEGEEFRHPVTKQVLGRVETAAGKAEVSETGPVMTGRIVEGTARLGDRLRISETKMKMVFIQEKKVDWYLGDDLYRKLKASGRVEMLDTSLDTDDPKTALNEGKRLNADVVLLLTAKEADKGTMLKERLYWVSDGSQFLDTDIKIDIAFAKELRFGEEFFSPMSGEALFRYELPYKASLVTTGDFDGDGKQEIAVSTGKDVFFYMPAVDLRPLWEIKGKLTGEHVWIDTFDLNKNGRDEIFITVMGSNEVTTYVYELTGTEFKKLWQTNSFVRKTAASVIEQPYSSSDGFVGEVHELVWNSEYKRGEKLKLPKGVNIYDFAEIEGPNSERFILAYDEKGFLNVFDGKGIRIWRSGAATGGFINTYKKQTTVSYMEGDTWSIKDRLLARSKETFVIQRVPLGDMIKGLGYKSSRIKSYWWNGFAMDERPLVDDIPGAAADQAIAGDKLLVISNPFLGLKFENLLKGESPLGSTLYIYSVRGR